MLQRGGDLPEENHASRRRCALGNEAFDGDSYSTEHSHFSTPKFDKVLADSSFTKKQFKNIIGPDLDFVGLPTRPGLLPVKNSAFEAAEYQWQKDSKRLELLVWCSYPTLQV